MMGTKEKGLGIQRPASVYVIHIPGWPFLIFMFAYRNKFSCYIVLLCIYVWNFCLYGDENC